MKNLTKLLGQIMLVCLMLVSSSAWAWWVGGHSVLVRAAVRSLPTEMPEFFRQGEDAIAHYVYDPDLAKNRAAKRRLDGLPRRGHLEQESSRPPTALASLRPEGSRAHRNPKNLRPPGAGLGASSANRGSKSSQNPKGP